MFVSKAEFLGRIHQTSHITSWKKRTQRRSSWAESFLSCFWPVSPCVPKEKNTEKKLLGRVLGPDTPVLGPSSWLGWIHQTSHITSQKKKEHREPVLEPSSWAEFLGRIHQTSHITSRKKRAQRRSSWVEFLGQMYVWALYVWPRYVCEHSHHITHHKPKEENTKKKFLGRVLGPDRILTTSHIITSHHIRHHKPKRQKSTSFLVKTSFKSIAEHQKVQIHIQTKNLRRFL